MQYSLLMFWCFNLAIRAKSAPASDKEFCQCFLSFQKYPPVEQSWPVQLGSQLQVPASARKAPCPEHWSMQEALELSHPGPPHPTKQWHSPWTHTPRPEHVGSRQSTKKRSKKTMLDTPATCCYPLPVSTCYLSIWAWVKCRWQWAV